MDTRRPRLTAKELLKVLCELQRVLECEKMVALLGFRINKEGGVWNDGLHPTLARHESTRENCSGHANFATDYIAPVVASVVV